jgi:hypothetical protein
MKMKRSLIIFILSILPIGLSAQSSILDYIFEDYAGKKEYQSVIYGKTMLSMMKDNASSDVKDLLDGIKMIRIISYKGEAEVLCDRVLNIIRNDYRLVSRITGDGKVSNFYLYEPDSSKRDMSFVMTVSGPQESVVLEILGKFDVKDITRLSVIGQKK